MPLDALNFCFVSGKVRQNNWGLQVKLMSDVEGGGFWFSGPLVT